MTGEKLLSQLLARMHICNPVELTNLCLKLPATANLAKFQSEVISKLVKEIEEKQFWKTVCKHEWLLEFFSFNGQPKTCEWSRVCQSLPAQLKTDYPNLPLAVFLEVLELFTWWFFAPVYGNLQLVFSASDETDNEAQLASLIRPKPKARTFSGRKLKKLRQRSLSINKEGRSLDLYLEEISKIKLINAAEEARLAKLIRQGDLLAREQLISANLRFVVFLAKSYQGLGLSLADLINEGNIGLIKAAKKFDETRGFKFVSYAVWWIRQAILEGLAKNSRLVRLPLNRVGTLITINKTTDRLEQVLSRPTSPRDIAKALQISEEEVRLTMDLARHEISLDAPLKADEDNTLHDTLYDEQAVLPHKPALKTSLQLEIEAVLKTLTLREADIISQYFGIGVRALVLEEIGDKLGLTRERVRQIKEKALRKLKRNNRSFALKSYWTSMDV